jgi:outer membrane protein
MQFRKLIPLAVLLVAATPATATDLAEIYSAAKDSDPQIRIAQAKWQATQAISDQTSAGLYPLIDFSANLSKVYDEDTDYDTMSYSLRLVQPLLRADRWAANSSSSARSTAAEAELVASQQELILRVADSYFNILGAYDDLTFAQAEKRAISRQLDQTKQRFEVGLIAITGVHEAQARYDQTLAREVQAENQVATAREALREITGRYHDKPLALKEDVQLVKPDPENVEQWANNALENNLSLRALQQSLEATRSDITRRRSGHYPTLDFVAKHDRLDINGGALPRDEETNTLSLQLVVPIYSGGGTSAQVREGEAIYEQTLQSLDQQRRSIERLTRDAYLGVILGITQVNALKQALLSSQTALDATQAGFEVGTRTIVDVLDAQRELFRSQRDYAAARYQYILSTLRLKQATGSLQPSDLMQVNSWLSEPTG